MKKPSKILSLLFILIIIFGLCVGCGQKETSMTRSQKAQAKAVEICEKYLNFEITTDEAKKQLESIADRLGEDDLSLDVDISYLAYILTKPNVDIDEFTRKYEYVRDHNY
ncbi:MAG: hypothetical protein J5659_06260 [Clostridia bacterium]|nr:hypothetical protein [Clostridia bacterium]